MKLATFVSASNAPAIGCVDAEGQTVLGLQAAHRALHGGDTPHFADMLSLIDGGAAALDLARKVVEKNAGAGPNRQALSAVRLLSPVPVPAQIRDFNNFEQHMRDASFGIQRLRARVAGKPDPVRTEAERAAAVIPDVYFSNTIYYTGNRFNVVGQDAEVEWPRFSEWFDYETEFGFFVWRKGKNISKAQAAEHIFGYTIFNDFSARDRQAREMEGFLGPAKGKSFDTGNAIGPWIVTRDEVPDTRALNVTVRINGEQVAKSTTAGMIHSFEDMIAYVSTDETLYPGEFFGSGTIGGCCGLETDRWLKDGDRIEIEFDKLGVLRNRVRRIKG